MRHCDPTPSGVSDDIDGGLDGTPLLTTNADRSHLLDMDVDLYLPFLPSLKGLVGPARHIRRRAMRLSSPEGDPVDRGASPDLEGEAFLDQTARSCVRSLCNWLGATSVNATPVRPFGQNAGCCPRRDYLTGAVTSRHHRRQSPIFWNFHSEIWTKPRDNHLAPFTRAPNFQYCRQN